MGLEKTVGYSSHKFLVFVSTADDSCQTPTEIFIFIPFSWTMSDMVKYRAALWSTALVFYHV